MPRNAGRRTDAIGCSKLDALPLAWMGITSVTAAALTLLPGCESCARGRGATGSVPVERIAPSASAAPTAAAGVPDPCRGAALPDDQHFVASGLCARLVAKKQGELRQITFAPNGDLFGVTIAGSIRRYRDNDGNGAFEGDEIVEWADTGNENGNNCDIDVAAGYLYAGTKEGVKRWKYAATLDRGGPGEDVMTGQPGGGNHPFHPVHVYDGFMYVDSGSSSNAVVPSNGDYDLRRSVVKRFDLSKLVPGKPFLWDEGEIFVRGVRNVTGFARNAAGHMIGVLSGIDDLHYDGIDVHVDNPGEEIVALEKDAAYGYPLCFAAAYIELGGKAVSPGTRLHAEWSSQNPLVGLTKSGKDDAWCTAHAAPPLSFMQAHSSPLGITFYEGASAELGTLPSRYRGGAFIALHGSWDRSPSTGYKVIWVPFDKDGKPPMPVISGGLLAYPYEVVFGGGSRGTPKDGAWSWRGGDAGESPVRPVGVAISPIDGALYVSSDNGSVPLQRPLVTSAEGNLYRVGAMRAAK